MWWLGWGVGGGGDGGRLHDLCGISTPRVNARSSIGQSSEVAVRFKTFKALWGKVRYLSRMRLRIQVIRIWFWRSKVMHWHCRAGLLTIIVTKSRVNMHWVYQKIQSWYDHKNMTLLVCINIVSSIYSRFDLRIKRVRWVDTWTETTHVQYKHTQSVNTVHQTS